MGCPHLNPSWLMQFISGKKVHLIDNFVKYVSPRLVSCKYKLCKFTCDQFDVSDHSFVCFHTTHKPPDRKHWCGSQSWQISYWMIFQAWWAKLSPGRTLMRCSQQLHAIFSSIHSSVIKQCKKCWRTVGPASLALEGKVGIGNKTTV